MTMPKTTEKPREFWITESRCTGKQKAHKTQLECWGEIQHNDNEYHVIEYAAYEKLKAENERLREQPHDSDMDIRATDDWLKLEAERDALKDNLAECYADFREIARVLADANRAIDELEAERDREREAANEMRAALESVKPYVAVSTPASLYSAKALEKHQAIIREALAKADEIRGGE